MSQKVRIDGVKHVGASVFLGVDHCDNPCWTRNPEAYHGVAVRRMALEVQPAPRAKAPFHACQRRCDRRDNRLDRGTLGRA